MLRTLGTLTPVHAGEINWDSSNWLLAFVGTDGTKNVCFHGAHFFARRDWQSCMGRQCLALWQENKTQAPTYSSAAVILESFLTPSFTRKNITQRRTARKSDLQMCSLNERDLLAPTRYARYIARRRVPMPHWSALTIPRFQHRPDNTLAAGCTSNFLRTDYSGYQKFASLNE